MDWTLGFASPREPRTHEEGLDIFDGLVLRFWKDEVEPYQADERDTGV